MIPQIIHYCWFGNQPKNYLAKKCIRSFKKISEKDSFQIIEWNESNCNMEENEYIKQAYKEKLWAFISDYFRLKALYEYGGVYLDTDVEIKKAFDEKFFDSDLTLGYMYECAISTAIIISAPKHPYIKGLLQLYKDKKFQKDIPNNVIFNHYTFKHYPQFKLNGKTQEFAPGCMIYPRYYFEVPTYNKEGGYSVHHFMGSWHNKPGKFKKIIRNIFKWCRFYIGPLDYWYQNYRRNKLVRHSSFYKKYLEDSQK